MNLHVRAWNRDDIPHIVRYWKTLTDDDAARMGCDLARFPSTEEYRRLLEGQLASPREKAVAFYSMWLVDGRTVGFSSLKNIQFGVHGEMHLHMWEATQRGKGIGGRLFCLSALDYYALFNVREIVCEPSAGNTMPNRMLQKVGFPIIGSRFGRTSDLSLATQVNTYAITLEVARSYLENQK